MSSLICLTSTNAASLLVLESSAKKLSSMLKMHTSRRLNSKTNMWENWGSSADDEQTAIIQSAVAASKLPRLPTFYVSPRVHVVTLLTLLYNVPVTN